MTTRVWIVECDTCHRQIDAVNETFHQNVHEGYDECNECWEES